MKTLLGKVLYAVLFCVVVPMLLVLWARSLAPKAGTLPSVHAPLAGGAVALVGCALVGRAMWDLWHRGGGLPMNAFPPPKFVASGAYRVLSHPIYVGFGLIVPGVGVALGSAAALWIVTPVTWLAMAALVVGYERIDLLKRFGTASPARLVSLPPATDEALTLSQKIRVAVLGLMPWVVGYEASVTLFSPARDLVDTMLPFERNWPVWESTAWLYLGTYVWTALAPLALPRLAEARRFLRTAWWGSAFIGWCFLAFPLAALPRPLDETSLAGRLLAWDRGLDTAACAFPSFHVFWAFVAADAWSLRIGQFASQLLALLIALSCLTTGTHSLVDVVAGWCVYVGARHVDAIWQFLCRIGERIANSWREWRFGAVRIINHGAYVALGTTLGLWSIGLLLGASAAPAIITVALCGIIGAGIWGQWLEASSQLSRPFGYFGGFFGCCVGALLAHLCWGIGWQLAGAFSLAAPLIQAMGRLRCLVQGCCHGHPVMNENLGIRYHHPRSRVCKLAKLDGVPVHPTPLYSILGNILIGGLLLRLWREDADLAFITGSYAILSTCARFMEEGYRGEPQTLRWGGLPIYQWLAIACLLGGIVVSALAAPLPPVFEGFGFAPLAYALPIGALVWFAMGLDFPESQRRMSRLA